MLLLLPYKRTTKKFRSKCLSVNAIHAFSSDHARLLMLSIIVAGDAVPFGLRVVKYHNKQKQRSKNIYRA